MTVRTFFLDINECSTEQPCSVHAECVNSIGSYSCNCYPGFEGNGETCDNINECEKHMHNCQENAHCVDTIGSYNCSCNVGYNGHCDECRGL